MELISPPPHHDIYSIEDLKHVLTDPNATQIAAPPSSEVANDNASGDAGDDMPTIPRQGAWGQLGTVTVVPRRLGNCFSGVIGTYLLTTEMRSRM